MASSVKDHNFKVKKKKFKAKSQKVKLFRSNEPLYSVFMWGVNHAVRREKPDELVVISSYCQKILP